MEKAVLFWDWHMALSHPEMILIHGFVSDLSYSMGKEASVRFLSVYKNILTPVNNSMLF